MTAGAGAPPALLAAAGETVGLSIGSASEDAAAMGVLTACAAEVDAGAATAGNWSEVWAAAVVAGADVAGSAAAGVDTTAAAEVASAGVDATAAADVAASEVAAAEEAAADD